MKSELEALKVRFAEIYPPEEDVRERRFRFAGYKCEFTGSTELLELHHIIEGKRRRSFFERFFTTRVVSENAHKGSGKADMIKTARKEVQQELLKDFTAREVLIITKLTKIYI